MYPEDLTETLFGKAACDYLARKHTGGTSGEKGNTYENFFAVYQLAKLAKAVLEANKDIRIASQIRAFVDDLIVIDADAACFRHYQLKNSPSVSWGTGLRSLADDFEKQYQLNQAISKESELHLVVSDMNLQHRLSASLPPTISSYSQVCYFPYTPHLLRVIAQTPDFREALAELSAFINPDEDKIECVATVLLGAWVSSGKASISLMELLQKAQQCQSSFIRSFSRSEAELDVEVAKILGEIPNFTYTLSKGFFHWEFKSGLDQGTLRYSCETEEFQRFQELIRQQSPTSFEEIEGFLL